MLVFILCTIAVVGLSVVDTLWFNAMPESNRYKNVQAFNVVTLWIVAIVLIIKLGNECRELIGSLLLA